MSLPPVLLTNARSLHTLAAAHCLAAHGIEVFGCDAAPLTALSFSKHCRATFNVPDHTEHPDDYIDALVAGLRELGGDDRPLPVLMPTHKDTPLIARRRERFDGVAHVAAPPIEAIEQVQPKHRLVDTADRLDVAIAPTQTVVTTDELDKIIDSLEFPVILKPGEGSSGNGVEKVDSAEELGKAFAAHVKKFPVSKDCPSLLQKAVGDDDYCLCVLCDQGEIVASMAYRNLQRFPVDQGYGVHRVSVDDSELRDLAAPLMRGVKWHGVAELDFRWDGNADTPAYLIEVNPRFWSGLFQSVESGVDFPTMLYRLAVDGTVDVAQFQTRGEAGVETKIPGLNALSLLLESIDHEDSVERIKTGWNESVEQARDGQWWGALKHFADEVGVALSPKRRVEHVKEGFGASADVAREVLDTDDPWAALGVLFVVSKLIKTGSLPKEVTRKPDKPKGSAEAES